MPALHSPSLLRAPLLTKTQHVIAGVAPELIPHLRALYVYTVDARRNAPPRNSIPSLNAELVGQILSALRTANQQKRRQAAPVVLLEAAWSRVCEALTNSASHRTPQSRRPSV